MTVSRKLKRPITVDGREYLWWVRDDDDPPLVPSNGKSLRVVDAAGDLAVEYFLGQPPDVCHVVVTGRRFRGLPDCGGGAFVEDGQPLSPEVERELEQHEQQRWYPEPGGHRVLVPFRADGVVPAHFTVVAGAWDHDTCDRCVTHIPAMTLCWVTRTGRYLTLCVACKSRMDSWP